MRITPLDIRHKEFTRALRGYKDAEVDEFLDEINEEFERLYNENVDYKEKLKAQEDRISEYQDVENTLHKALISAQQRAEELKRDAQKEADLILRDAEHKSHSIVNESYVERQRVQREVQSLQKKHDDLRYQLSKIIETYALSIRDHEAIITDDLMGSSQKMDLSDKVQDPIREDSHQTSASQEAIPRELPASHRSKDETVGVTGDLVPRESLSETAVPEYEPGAAKADVARDSGEEAFANVEIDVDEDIFKW